MGEIQDTSAQNNSGELFFYQGSYCGWGKTLEHCPMGNLL